MLCELEWCMHVHIAEGEGSPVPEIANRYERLFRILRDIHEGAVSCACAWISTEGGQLDLAKRPQRRSPI